MSASTSPKLATPAVAVIAPATCAGSQSATVAAATGTMSSARTMMVTAQPRSPVSSAVDSDSARP